MDLIVILMQSQVHSLCHEAIYCEMESFSLRLFKGYCGCSKDIVVIVTHLLSGKNRIFQILKNIELLGFLSRLSDG